ncbi:protein Wnt-4-like [Limulus polyphemus]|uniref:Protein Wnt n=1 Tax=Limulus polyphemus TaxID=6850 RepID=A0ABM1TB09_LIMPO|nr:protein Wnt-4-like [Limulus polyphemus]
MTPTDKARQINLLVFIFCLYPMSDVHATWWLLGMPSTYQSTMELNPTSYANQCKQLYYLVERQRELCSLSYNILHTVSRGAKIGIEECQHQFQMSRWNCTTFNNISSVFGGILAIKSREKAYVYAISSAGVAYSITRGCSTGELTVCGCDNRIRIQNTRGRWEWGGCSEDIGFGSKFSRDFVDSGEDTSTEEGLMNLHNNRAGRMALKKNMELLCKCHGVSGSCSMRVCWKQLKPFRQVGEWLTRKFDGATHVQIIKKHDTLRLVPWKKDIKKPSRKDLVYLEEAPDYCYRNETLGVLGTEGRRCNNTSYGMDGCRLLCCGRGYHTVERVVEEKCNCKFEWCCRVVCEKCRFKREEHFCN